MSAKWNMMQAKLRAKDRRMEKAFRRVTAQLKQVDADRDAWIQYWKEVQAIIAEPVSTRAARRSWWSVFGI